MLGVREISINRRYDRDPPRQLWCILLRSIVPRGAVSRSALPGVYSCEFMMPAARFFVPSPLAFR